MKKLMQRFFGIAVSAAMLFTSGMTAWADDGHAHRTGDKSLPSPETPAYTITLTKPAGVTIDESAAYGAYQIFTGTVVDKDYKEDDANPGSEGTPIPITDIKWGDAFGDVGTETWQKNIVGFVLALAKPYLGDDDKFKSAFANFHGFDDETAPFITNDGYLAERFAEPGTKINADSSVEELNKVKYDKLATAVADVIAVNGNHEWLQAFTDILGGYGKDYGTSINANKGFVNQYYPSKAEGDEYKIGVPKSGYYMILDRTDVEKVNEAYSARMLFVVNNITQELKEDVPQLDKQISRDDGYYETEAAGVGDDVNFRLTGSLPSNYDNYTLGYQFIFTDTLSAGLTLKGTDSATVYPFSYNTAAGFSVSVLGVYDVSGNFQKNKQLKIATTDHAADGTHTHATTTYAYNAEVKKDGDTGIQTLTVTFPCLKEIKITNSGETYTLGEDSVIYIDYTAIVNKNAIVSPTKGNKNTAILTYSDNPQSYDDIDNTTPDDATVYTFGLDIVKIDAADFLKNDGDATKAGLDGAGFILVREKVGESDTYEIAKFAKVDALLALDPNAPFGGKEYYSIDSWEELGKLTGGTTLEKLFDDFVNAGNVKTDYELTTYSIDDENGHLNISGLNDGIDYTMVETETPAKDYAKIDPFTFKLTAATTEIGGKVEYTGTISGVTSTQAIADDKSFTFAQPLKFETSDTDGNANTLVANFKYTDLPSTGGVGTVWFYILGAGGVGLAGVLFFLSKKKVTK